MIIKVVENFIPSHSWPRLLRPPPESQLDSFHVQPWDPALRYQTLLTGVQVEIVEGVVDSLDLAHLNKQDLGEKERVNFLAIMTQVYIIHDVPVFCPRWIFQVPIKTPKFGTWNSQNLVENLKFEPRPP